MWQAQYQKDGVLHYLGCFEDDAEAFQAIMKFKEERQTKSGGGEESKNGEVMGRGDGTGGDGGCAPVHAHV